MQTPGFVSGGCSCVSPVCGATSGERQRTLWLDSARYSAFRTPEDTGDLRISRFFQELPILVANWKDIYFLGLRPLAGYASLKLYSYTMSRHVFCMRNVACAMIWLVRLCMLPTLTPDDAGDASFLGPSRDPTQKADMGSRQRQQKEQPK